MPTGMKELWKSLKLDRESDSDWYLCLWRRTKSI